MRLERAIPNSTALLRGGLSSRRQRLVLAYIEELLAEEIALTAIARLARLSPYHFAHAFRNSFGVRQRVACRGYRAQELLLTQRWQ